MIYNILVNSDSDFYFIQLDGYYIKIDNFIIIDVIESLGLNIKNIYSSLLRFEANQEIYLSIVIIRNV